MDCLLDQEKGGWMISSLSIILLISFRGRNQLYWLERVILGACLIT